MPPSGPHQIKAAIEHLENEIVETEERIECDIARLPQLRSEIEGLEKQLAWWNRSDEEIERDAREASRTL